jgi:hypothetical protein
MKHIVTKKWWHVLAVFGLVWAASGAAAQAEDLKTVAPTTPELKALYAELQQDWWNWAASIKAQHHPFGDETGEDCDRGQQGDVWFLAGVFGEFVDDTTQFGSADRTCFVPEGKAIFFPVLNTIFTNIGEDPPFADADLEDAVAFFNGAAQDLKVTLDGKDVAMVKQRFESESGAFNLNYTANGIFGRKPGTTRAADAGYYILLEPPTPGEHVLEFEGQYVFTEADFGFDFTFGLKIRYTLVVGL